MVGPGRGGLSRAALATALDYIRAMPQIWEVILTGGDPLVLSPRRLKEVTTKLAAIDHVKVIRVHTRVPVAAPEQISPALVRALRSTKAAFVVLHANHPRELTESARAAIARFVDAGIPVLSQSVLLRGVNDNAETLGALMRTLVECRVKPYYLHHRRPGARHRASAHVHRGRPKPDARTPRPLFGLVPAVLCTRHSRRLRQITDRPGLFESGRFDSGRFQRAAARLSAAAIRRLIRPPRQRIPRSRTGSRKPRTTKCDARNGH